MPRKPCADSIPAEKPRPEKNGNLQILPALIIPQRDIPDSNLWSGHRNSLEAKISSLHSMRRPPSLVSMTPKSPAYLFLVRGDEAMLGNSCLAFGIIGFVNGEYQRILQQQGWVLAYTRCWHKIMVQVGTVVSERLVHFSLHLQAEGVRYLFSNRLQHPLPVPLFYASTLYRYMKQSRRNPVATPTAVLTEDRLRVPPRITTNLTLESLAMGSDRRGALSSDPTGNYLLLFKRSSG